MCRQKNSLDSTIRFDTIEIASLARQLYGNSRWPQKSTATKIAKIKSSLVETKRLLADHKSKCEECNADCNSDS